MSRNIRLTQDQIRDQLTQKFFEHVHRCRSISEINRLECFRIALEETEKFGLTRFPTQLDDVRAAMSLLYRIYERQFNYSNSGYTPPIPLSVFNSLEDEDDDDRRSDRWGGGHIPVVGGHIPVVGGHIPVVGGHIPVVGGQKKKLRTTRKKQRQGKRKGKSQRRKSRGKTRKSSKRC